MHSRWRWPMVVKCGWLVLWLGPGLWAQSPESLVQKLRQPQWEREWPLVLPWLSQSDNQLTHPVWQALFGRPLPPAFAGQLLALLDHTSPQVRLNALTWAVHDLKLAEAQPGRFSPPQAKVWRQLLQEAQASDPWLASGAITLLLPLLELEPERVWPCLEAFLVRPPEQEQQVMALGKVCDRIAAEGLLARRTLPALAEAWRQLPKGSGLKPSLARAWAALETWPEPMWQEVELLLGSEHLAKIDNLVELAQGLAEQGPRGQAQLQRLVQRFPADPRWNPSLARAGLIPAEPQAREKLSDADPLVQEAAAYALRHQVEAHEALKRWWLDQAQPRLQRRRGLGYLLATLQALQLEPTPLSEAGPATMEMAVLRRLLTKSPSDPHWQQFRQRLSQPGYPAGWWRCGSLGEWETTRLALELLAQDPPLELEPVAVKLLTLHPDPAIRAAAEQAYRALWLPNPKSP